MARTKAELAELIAEAGGEVSDPDSMTVAQMEELLSKLEAEKAAAGNDTAPGGDDTTEGDDGDGDGEDKLKALAAPGGVTRRKINRGSTRRINRALATVQKALTEFADELDVQVYITDEEGNRTGEHDLVKGARAIRDGLSAEVAKITTP